MDTMRLVHKFLYFPVHFLSNNKKESNQDSINPRNKEKIEMSPTVLIICGFGPMNNNFIKLKKKYDLGTN